MDGDPATHDIGDDHGVDDPATHDIGDDKGVDNPATHDVADDHGGVRKLGLFVNQTTQQLVFSADATELVNSTQLLDDPLGNHLVVIYGHHASHLRAWWREMIA